MKEKIVALLTDKRFWKTTGWWTLGISAGVAFVLGCGVLINAFAESPWEWLGIMSVVGVVGAVFGLASQLQYAPMDDEEVAKRVTAIPWPER